MGTQANSSPPHSSAATSVTHAVLLTPPGRGAIATVLVDGPRATDCVAKQFRAANGRPLAEQPLERIVFGRWFAERGAEPGEELVICRRSERRVEIHCHGGRAAAAAVLDALSAAGCTPCKWTDWLAAIGADPLEVAARRALASATTSRTASILLDQFHGALRTAIDHVVSLIDRGEIDAAIDELTALLQHADLGLHLTRPWRVVLAGRPNVGKSSLINALVGYERAIVFDRPGTTRDVVTATTAVDGWPIELADTAGLCSYAAKADRYSPESAATDDLESTGMRQAGDRMQSADLVIWVVDAAALCSRVDAGEPFEPTRPEGALVVANKIDLLFSDQPPDTGRSRTDLERNPNAASQPEGKHSTDLLPPGATRTSATLGTGIDQLARSIAARLVPTVPPPGAAVPFTAEQVTALTHALSELKAGNASAAREHLGRLC